jgi:hypothetical protein
MLFRILGLISALIYIFFGAVLVMKKPLMQLDALWQTILGAVMIAYGLFRLYRFTRSVVQ